MRAFSVPRLVPHLSRVTNVALVFVAIGALVLLSSIGAGVRLMAGTLVVMGGNSNPTSEGMEHGLGGSPLPPGTPNNTGFPSGVPGKGYLDPNNPDSPYFGFNYQRVNWPAQLPLSTGWDGSTTFEGSQRGGHTALQTAIDAALQTGDPVTAVGYSSSANVVVREMRRLAAIGSPDTDKLSFVLVAGMNRPNGGLAQRFPGLFVPFFGIKLDGSTPTDTQYETLDVSWEYDTISDFPNYPLNLLATLNALMGFTLHINYLPASLDGPRARPDYKDPDSNITYVTLAAPYLPLLLPLRLLGVPKQLIDLVEPALKVLVDLGYNRAINPGTPTPASLLPTPQRLLALPFELLDAIGVGIRRALNPKWDRVPAPAPEVEADPAAASLPETGAGGAQLRLAATATGLTDAPADGTEGLSETPGAPEEVTEDDAGVAAEPIVVSEDAAVGSEQPVTAELESELPEATPITTRQRTRESDLGADDLSSGRTDDAPTDGTDSSEPADAAERRESTGTAATTGSADSPSATGGADSDDKAA